MLQAALPRGWGLLIVEGTAEGAVVVGGGGLPQSKHAILEPILFLPYVPQWILTQISRNNVPVVFGWVG